MDRPVATGQSREVIETVNTGTDRTRRQRPHLEVPKQQMTVRFHQSALRKGRFSEPGLVYTITNCIEGRYRLLVPDPEDPLRNPEPAEIVIDSLKWCHDNGFWNCFGYVVMPDHIHLIVKLGETRGLSEVMQSFGNFTALKLNRQHGRSGKCWQKTFYDRNVRDDNELYNQLNYVYENPVRRGHVERPEDWPFSAIYPEW